MPDVRTELTEIATGLGTLDFDSLGIALNARPNELTNISDGTVDRLIEAISDETTSELGTLAFLNGKSFLGAPDGLRGRRPIRIEWKGPDRPPGYDLLPADLRIDHVYIVSCKYRSKVLMNASPGHFFDNLLKVRAVSRQDDWYQTVTPEAYQDFYAFVRTTVRHADLPDLVTDLRQEHRDVIRRTYARRWPAEFETPYGAFCHAVSQASALRWSSALPTLRDRESMLWRLLRLSDAPYFVLGADLAGSVRLRIATPWDWRQEFRLLTFEIHPTVARQPRVNWSAGVQDLLSNTERTIEGHIEIRWSHGRFCGAPEAKVYLDTPIGSVPGYHQLAA